MVKNNKTSNKKKPQKLHKPRPIAYRETPEAAKAKQIYLELGEDRTHEKVVEVLGRKPGYKRQIERWSSRFAWVEAAKKHDVEQVKEFAKAYRKKLDEQMIRMNEEQARVAQELFLKASKRLNALLDESLEFEKRLWGREAVALFKEAAALERLARGAATERTEIDHGVQEGTQSLTIVAQFGAGAIGEEKE